MPTREASAYHEAGHAVMAFLLGHRITSVTIKPGVTAEGESYSGMVYSRPRGRIDFDVSTPAMRIKVENMIMVTLAGDVAQRRFNPRSSRNWHASADRSAAADMAFSQTSSGEQATAFLAWLHIRTRDVIHGRWNVVERVAAALMDRETLSATDLREVIFGRPAYRIATRSETAHFP